jgi:hypothetical protein
MTATEAPLVFELKLRACDACGGVDLETIWTNDYTARTRSGEVRFTNRNVVCRRCGFAFVSPCPAQSELDRYYADCLAHFAGQPPSSDVAVRVAHVTSRVPSGLDGIEIGGNRLVEDDRIRTYFRSFASVEPNEEIAAQYSRIEQVPPASADVLMHYYVLEHASDPRAFLGQCRRILRPGGMMICEMPDLKLYPRYIGEYVWWEHISHFSLVSLARIAAACGFRLVDAGHRNCSHERGMLAVFECTDIPAGTAPVSDPVEVIDALASMREGFSAISAFDRRLAEARAEVDATAAAGGRVTLWGANEVMRRLLAPPYVLPAQALVVDDDERKTEFIDGLTVRRPPDVLEHLAGSGLLLIASSRLADILQRRARALAGAQFNPAVRIVDYEMLRAQ